MSVFIRQLTGVRFVAAAWVLLYHLQGPLDNVGLLAIPVIPDVLNVGRLGVDLFFALSGFILTHTYLSRLGQRARLRETLNFWWLRLARVYPVHLVMLVVAGLALFAQAKVTGDSLDRAWLNPLDFIRNLLLIQEWGPEPQRGWNFVAWSLSMEWLAYLIFPILILVIWRCNKRLGLPMLIVLWFACITPLVGYGLSRTDSYYTDNWGSTIRILTEFTAGAITYLIVRRLLPEGSDDPGRRTLQGANALSWLLPLAVVAGSVLLANLAIAQPPITLNTSGDAEPMPPYFHLLLVPFLIAWLGALALARGRVSRGLATKTLVLGGFISYSLYMTHLVVFGLWRAGMRAAGIDSGVLYAAGLLVLVAAALAIAWLMWRFVEEPAREWMRGRAGVRRAPTEEAGEAIAERLDSGAEPVSLPGEPGSTPQANPGAKPKATP